jgi:hypothetical protein
MVKDPGRPTHMGAHGRIASYLQNTPPPHEVVTQSKRQIETLLLDESKKRRAEQRLISEHSRIIRAPLSKIIQNDAHAVEAQEKLRQTLRKQTKPDLPLPNITPIQPKLMSGSILALASPPYPYPWDWTDPNGSGMEEAFANPQNGQLGGLAWSDEGGGPQPEGYGQAGCGFGIPFSPMSDGMLTVYYQLAFNATWYESSQIDVAHTNGRVRLLIYQYDLDWTFQGTASDSTYWVWSDGTSWFETHSGGKQETVTSTPTGLQVSSNNNYLLWFLGYWEADGQGDPNGPLSSMARCWVNASLPFVVLGTS